MPRRDRRRLQRAILFRAFSTVGGTSGARPWHDQGHLCRSARRSRKNNFTRRASITPVDLGAFGLFVKQQIPAASSRSKTTSTGTETSASSLQGRARAPPVSPRSLAARDVTFRRRCCRHRPAVRQTDADRGDLPRRQKSSLWLVSRERPALDPCTSRRPPRVGCLGLPRRHAHRNGRRASGRHRAYQANTERDVSFPSWSWLQPSCAEQKSSALSTTFVSPSPRSPPSSSYDFSRGSLRG